MADPVTGVVLPVGFIGMMALGLSSETKNLVSIYKKGDKYIQIEDNGKAAKELLQDTVNSDKPIKSGEFVPIPEKKIPDIETSLPKFKTTDLPPYKLTTATNSLKDIRFNMGVAAGIGAAVSLGTTGKLNPTQLAYDVGGAGAAEAAEKVIKTGIEKAGMSAANKLTLKTVANTGIKAGSKVATTGVKAAGSSIAKWAASAATGVGVLFAVSDITNMVLDIADVCGYNTKEIYQKDIDDIYAEYVKIYTDMFKDMGLVFEPVAKPDIYNENQETEQNLLFLEYLDRCNLKLPENIDDILKKKKLRQRRLFYDTITGDILESSNITKIDDNYDDNIDNSEEDIQTLLMAIVIKKALEKKKIEQAKLNSEKRKKWLYILIFIVIVIIWTMILLK